MSVNNPYAAVFEVQRAAIEGARTAAQSSITVSQTATEAAVESLNTTKSVQKSGVEFSQRAAHAYLDTVEESGIGGVEDVRAFVDEQFEAVDAFHDDAWEAFESTLAEFEASVDELSDAQAETVEEAFDALVEAQGEVEAAADEAADAVDIDVDDA